jgi:hypothetical protein
MHGAPRFGSVGSPFGDAGLREALARAIVQTFEQKPVRVARGNFGCIYAPPPACIDGSRLTVSPTAVGKVSAADDDYETEAAVLARLETIDPEHRFHVRYYGSCLTRDRPDCELDEPDEDGDEAQQDRGLLVMERAEPMDPATYPVEMLPDAFARLWEGLEAMAAAGIRYEDLHTGNLLLGEDGLWRMIDFGGCTLDGDAAETRRIHAREMRLLIEASFAHTRIGQRWIQWLRDEE